MFVPMYAALACSCLLPLSALVAATPSSSPPYYLLQPSDFANVLGEDYEWATENVPLFESSNATLTEVYYFRWRTFRSHIHPTNRTDGVDWVVTEFAPDVSWAGEFNTINCAAAHHMAELGWMRNRDVLDSYTTWWTLDAARHNYFYWWASAARRNFQRTGDTAQLRKNVPSYKAQFLLYAAGKLPEHNAVFSSEYDCAWNSPGNEGQENSLSGPGCRPLVQAMFYGEASALAELCAAIGDEDGAAQMQAQAQLWQQRLLKLWNPSITSFDTLQFYLDTDTDTDTDTAEGEGGATATATAAESESESPPPAKLSGVRELASLTSPWFFGAVPSANASAYATSWDVAVDPMGFAAPYGLRTAEKRADGYRCDFGCCYWNGAMWPFETSKAITAAINVLNDYPAHTVPLLEGGQVLWDMLWQYTQAHTSVWRVLNQSRLPIPDITKDPITAPNLFNGTGDLWIAETGCADTDPDLNIATPAWTDDAGQGYRYNHATFMDLVISGVAGLKPFANGSLVVNPLLPASAMSYWAVDGVALHGRIVTAAFDSEGAARYGAQGLQVWVDGKLAGASKDGSSVTVQLV